MVVALQASYQVGGRTKSCFFETDSWFRVPRDGNGRGCLGVALPKALPQLSNICRNPRRVTWPLILPSYRAVPDDAAAMKRAVTAASTVQDAQFYARPTRHGVIKCYREFVVGRPVCRHFRRWWW